MARRILNSDIRIFYSSASAGGKNYLGGARSLTELSDNFLHNLFGKTTEDEQITGITKLRCFYVFNSNPDFYLKNPYVFVVSDTTSPNDYVEVGWGTAEIGTGLSGATDDSIEQSIADQFTDPEGVEFFKSNFRSGGAILNADIPPLKAKACWVRYVSQFNAEDLPYNTFRLRVGADNLISTAPEKTGPPPAPIISFAVIGECSSDEDFTKIISNIVPSNPTFILTTGNNNVDANPAFFITSMGASLAKTMIAFGPDDIRNETVINTYVNKIASLGFVPEFASQTYYSKNIGNVHVLVMDTSGLTPYTKPSAQYSFIENDLNNAFTDPNIDWIFVVTNRATYGSPTTVFPPEFRFQYQDISSTYGELFTKTGVLVVFQGQYNFYERTKVLKFNPENISDPVVFAYDGPDNYHIFNKKSFIDGSIYITVGTGGSLHDPVVSPVPYSAFRDTVDFGYVKVIVDNTLEFPKVMLRFYETSRGGSQIFVDQMTVTRNS
jgi:hypothetical protein